MSEPVVFDETTTVSKRFLAAFLKAEKCIEHKAFHKAAAIYRRILRHAPRHLIASRNLGSALAELKQHDQALAVFRHALRHHPDEPELHYNAGVVLQRLRRPQEAAQAYLTALQLRPGHLQAMENLSVLMMNLGQFDLAHQHLDHALGIAPTRAGTLFTLSLLMLLHGQWHDGWHLYEYRWDTPDFKTDSPNHNVLRRWSDLAALRDRSVLLVREQGLGDTLQFCRYALLLASHGAKVTLLVQDSLQALLQSLNRFKLPHPIHIVTASTLNDSQRFDHWAPLLSLPFALMQDYPRVPAIAKYLSVSPQDIAQARQQLVDDGRPHIGLAWSGNPEHKNDHHRSAPFAQFARLLGLNAHFHILQTQIHTDEEAVVHGYAAQLTDHRGFLTDFQRTASLLECMDLVIAVDTAVVHLAAALARPTWIALALTPDFRWMLEREDSPWYPSVRLFRQQHYNDWPGLMTSICQELAHWLDVRTRAASQKQQAG